MGYFNNSPRRQAPRTLYGIGLALCIMACAQTAPAQATGSFHVANGQIIDPNGQPFVARGINISEFDLSTVSTSSNVTPLLTAFPSPNFVRVLVYNYDDPSYFQNFIAQATAKGIVVELEDHHNSNGTNAGGGQVHFHWLHSAD